MKTVMMCLLLLVPFGAVAEDSMVTYAGGTVPGIKESTTGKLDMASDNGLQFTFAGGRLLIPYADIDSFEYTRPVARHLGVLPALAVGLLKQRQHRHIFRISYHDGNRIPQVAVFEVPKHMPRTLEAVFQTRSPKLCDSFFKCQNAP